jgi:asparagine synthase (glutamine-hydrolysing)
MSAIYGLIGEANLAELTAMGERLTHRGNQVNEWSPFPGVFIGYREFGDDSAIHWDQNRSLVASATLYNKDELVDKIRRAGGESGSGHVFEILGGAYRALGPNCFTLFHGDFAVAIWDEAGKKLILARDKLGCRIIYYWRSPGRFAFASEYKALLALEDLLPEPDLPSIQYFQASKYLLPGRTLLDSVFSVPAAHYLEVSTTGIESHRYWSVEIQPTQLSIEDASTNLRRYFLRSMERRLEGVDLLQAELSGGIDSAAVVAAIGQIRPGEDIHTYTIGSGPQDSEVLAAQRIADQFKTVHQEIYSDPYDLIDYLPQMVFHIEDPVGRTESCL